MRNYAAREPNLSFERILLHHMPRHNDVMLRTPLHVLLSVSRNKLSRRRFVIRDFERSIFFVVREKFSGISFEVKPEFVFEPLNDKGAERHVRFGVKRRKIITRLVGENPFDFTSETIGHLFEIHFVDGRYKGFYRKWIHLVRKATAVKTDVTVFGCSYNDLLSMKVTDDFIARDNFILANQKQSLFPERIVLFGNFAFAVTARPHILVIKIHIQAEIIACVHAEFDEIEPFLGHIGRDKPYPRMKKHSAETCVCKFFELACRFFLVEFRV